MSNYSLNGGSSNADDFVANLDELRGFVAWLNSIDEGSFSQATWVADHRRFFEHLVDSAKNVQLEEFPYSVERNLAIVNARENDYV